MAENDDLSPEEIAQIRTLLQQYRIDPNVPIRKANKLPTESELGVGRLTMLGKIKRKLVYVWAVGATIVTILAFPKDCIEIQDFYAPKCHAVVEQVAEVINNLMINPPSVTQSFPPNHQDKYYAFNPEWRALSDEELQFSINGTNEGIPNDQHNKQYPREPITIIGSTGNTTQSIISGSGIIRGLS